MLIGSQKADFMKIKEGVVFKDDPSLRFFFFFFFCLFVFLFCLFVCAFVFFFCFLCMFVCLFLLFYLLFFLFCLFVCLLFVLFCFLLPNLALTYSSFRKEVFSNHVPPYGIFVCIKSLFRIRELLGSINFKGM